MSETTFVTAAPPSVDAVGTALAGAYAVAPGPASEIDRVYYDTFDGLVRAAGCVLLHQQGRLTLQDRETHVALDTVSVPEAPSAPLLATALPPGSLRDRLAELIEVRAVTPLVQLRVRTAPIRVLDHADKTVVRVSVESALRVTLGRGTALSSRVRLEPVRGYDKDLTRTREALLAALPLIPEEQPLLDEALIAAGRPPAGISSKPDVALTPEQPAEEAAVAVLRRLLETIDDNLPGTIADTDSEFLHDYRVAVRRTRSVQRELKGVFPPEQLADVRAGFKWLQQVTGPSRDLDVYVLEFDEMRALVPEPAGSDLEPLLETLRSRRLVARRAMVRDLRSEYAARLRSDWEDLLISLPAHGDQDRPDARRPIGEVAAERIRKVHRKIVRMGDAIDAGSPPEEYHELRKKGKELRYLLELFGAPLHDPAVVKPMIKSLKALQDVLGRHQDREVQVGMLHSLRDEVSARAGGAAALMAMGQLVDRLQEDAERARHEFGASFAEFASKEQRKLVKETFR